MRYRRRVKKGRMRRNERIKWWGSEIWRDVSCGWGVNNERIRNEGLGKRGERPRIVSIEVSMPLTKLNEFSQVGDLNVIAWEMERGRIGESVERFTWEGRTAEDARGMADILLAGWGRVCSLIRFDHRVSSSVDSRGSGCLLHRWTRHPGFRTMSKGQWLDSWLYQEKMSCGELISLVDVHCSWGTRVEWISW